MDLISAFAALSTDGIGVLQALGAAVKASSVAKVAAAAGCLKSQISHYVWVGSFFEDETVQAEATKAQLSLAVTEILAKAVNRGNKDRDKNADMIRLCQLVAGLDADTAKAVIRNQTRQWQKSEDSDKADFAHMHKEVEDDGKRRLVARLRDDRASEVHRILHHTAKAIMKTTAVPYPVAYADALCQKILGAGTTRNPLFAPMFIIPTDCQYFDDGRIATTAGALVDLADLVNEPLQNTGYAAVMAKDKNGVPAVVQLVPVQHHSRERFASPEIRLIATMEMLKCSRPGCGRPAATCEMHHITAWSLGGETTPANITALCSTDNGFNDDNPSKPPKHGRIERDPITGRPGLRSEPGARLEFNQHPVVKKGTRTLGEQFYGLQRE